jgi:hypothetical protein
MRTLTLQPEEIAIISIQIAGANLEAKVVTLSLTSHLELDPPSGRYTLSVYVSELVSSKPTGEPQLKVKRK